MKSNLWSKWLRKTLIKTTFNFPAEEEGLCIRKKSVSVNSMGHKPHVSFFHSDFHMEKTGIRGYFYLLFLIERFKGDIFDWEYPLLTESAGTFTGICLFTFLID